MTGELSQPTREVRVLYDLKPRMRDDINTGEDMFTSTRLQIAHQTVLHDQHCPSHLVVPVIPR